MEDRQGCRVPCGTGPIGLLEDTMLPPVLQEFDSHNSSLKNQIEFYKQEHNNLRADVTALLEENQQLAAQLKVALGSSLGQEPAGECRRRTADMVANLQRQLLLTSQEKAAAMELYQNAVKEIEALEAELAEYRGGGQLAAAERNLEGVKKEYSTAINMLEDKVKNLGKDLERERERRAELENELGKLRTERDRLAATLKDRDAQLEDAIKAHQDTQARLEALQKRLAELEGELDRVRRERDELEVALADTAQRGEELGRREWAAIARVEEALTLVDAAVLEKDAALAAESRAQEEVSRLQRSMEQLLEEAGKRVAEETGRLKQQFNSQLEVLLRDMRELQDEIARKRAQLEKALNDMNQMEQEIEALRKERASFPDPAQMQHSIDNAYRELRRCEQHAGELAGDRDRLLQRLEEADQAHRAEMNAARDELYKLRQEMQVLRAQADQADATAQARAMLLEDQIIKLEQQLNALQCAGQPTIPDDQVHMQCEAQLEEYRRIVSALTDMQQRGMRVAHELQVHLDAQVEAKQRWQTEVKTMSSRFEKRIESLRGQLGGLKRANRNLERQLAETSGPCPGSVCLGPDPNSNQGPSPATSPHGATW